ncbi:MAG: acyl-CoA thioesterase [Planctomycetaceae bacterium]|nr:acyl-CoA thioesterase [Planctomycetaceae bacterium]
MAPSAPTRRSFQTQQQVRFGHVDPAGIAYYPRIFDYVHEAFEELWDVHVGERYYHLLGERRIGFPLVHSDVDFSSPLRFGDRPIVTVTCFHLGRSSLGLRYRYDLAGTLCVEARMTTVCVELDTLKSLDIPAPWRTRFEQILERPGEVHGSTAAEGGVA